MPTAAGQTVTFTDQGQTRTGTINSVTEVPKGYEKLNITLSEPYVGPEEGRPQPKQITLSADKIENVTKPEKPVETPATPSDLTETPEETFVLPAGEYKPRQVINSNNRKWHIESVAHTGKQASLVTVDNGPGKPFKRQIFKIQPVVKVEEKTEDLDQEIKRIRETLKNPNLGLKQRDELEARLDELEAKPQEKPAPEGTAPATEDELSKLFDELAGEAPKLNEQELSSMFDELAGVASTTPSATPSTAPKTVPGLVGSAAKETATGLAKSIDALGELFGAGNTTTLRSGIGFDEETYAKAKPIFLEAISHLKQAAADIRQAMKMIIDMVKAKFGQPVLERMKQYVIRFVQDIQSGAIKTPEESKPETKPEEVKPNLLTPEGKFQVAQELADILGAGGEFNNIVQARKKIEEITGQKIEAGTELAKQADETVETAVVLAAREIVRNSRKEGNNVTYDRLVGLYDRQPNLSVRSSDSIREQAYSTPVPLAYIASELAGINNNTTVLEPTAGNGMLLIGASFGKSSANELNALRASMLRSMGFDVTEKNAATEELSKPKSEDVVIANPPFGAVKDNQGRTISFAVKDGYSTNEIDHAIAFKALEAMKDDGRAVLIVGGVLPTTEEGRKDAYRGASKRSFYYNLYNKYNVVDHFTVDGGMYTKQGASYPVDVIVINGRGESERALPAADLPQIFNSWEKLKEKLNGSVVSTRNERPAGTPSGENQTGDGNGEGVAGGARGPSTGTGGEGGAKGVTPSEQGAGPSGGRPGGRGAKPSDGKLESTGVPPGVDTRQEGVPGEGGVQPGGTEGTTGNEPTGVGGPSGSTGERIGSTLKDRRGAETETATQVEYVPRSGASSVGTLSPVAMQQATQESLDRIVEQHGDIDNYVAEALEMDPETLKLNFSAEQVDALALAISNAQAGKGFIIGDQTGIGKGRVVAAMIKYALVNDKIPIFVTEKPNLYADMIRDLDDIGMTNELGLDQKTTKILMTNSRDSVPYTFVREKNGEITETNFTLKAPAKGKDLNDLMAQMQIDNSLGNPPFYKVIFTTYSQLQAVRKNTTERQRFINHFAAGNYIILDESHNAGGAGEAKGKKGEEKEEVTGRAGFVRGLVQRSFGSFFSSATYAKRPDVMSLYSSTNMSLAVDNPSKLGEAIKNGGVPMQQAVATMLTKDGQYIRRERTFAGVAYDTVPAEVNKETAENMASAMRSILAFSRAKEGVVKGIQKELDKQGKVAGEIGEKTTVQGANFGSIMHNLIDQMLLALKVEQAVKQATELLKAGEKPVLTVSNTMGSFLADYAEEMGLRVGDPVALSFKDMYLRYLRTQRIIKIKAPNGPVTEHYLSDQELGPQMTEAYNRIADQIEKAGFGAAPISPIDYIKNELQKVKITDIDGNERNVNVDEITGRTVTVNYGEDTPILGSRSSSIRNRVNAVKGFNNGTIDVLILNQAGSTGLSLHASQDIKVKDKRKRHMIIVQAEKNIDTHMQMLGRVHRTGQVIAPAYSQMMADIPAEMRPAAVLMKKMASLNANTTASRKSAVTAEGVVDFINDYGGQVAQEFLRDNPEIHSKLGGSKVLPLDEDSSEANEDDIRKLTGYIPILPIEEQEKIYADLVARYNELIALEDSLGNNKLEAKEKDLDAKTLSTEPITEQKEALSLFAAPAIMERVDVKRTVKPYSSEEVNQIVKDRLNGEQASAIARAQEMDLRERSREYYRKVIGNLESQETPDLVKIQTTKDSITASVNRTVTLLQLYRIGTPISITDSLGQRLYGVVTNVTNSKRTENPAAGSDWKMQIALSNGEDKTLTLSFSQIGSKYKLAEERTINWYNPETQQAENISLMQTFDKGATVRREKRWIVTGNLLAGFAKFPGQIISYTKDDGTIGQGILMSRQFDFEKIKQETPVEFSNPQEIIEFLNSKSSSEIGTPDGHLLIRKERSNYLFSATKPKKSGGQYHQDPNLTEITGTFFSRGNLMVTGVWIDDQFIEAINYLKQKGVQLIAKGNQIGARQLRDQKLKGSAPSGSLAQNAQNMYMSGRRSATKMSKADINKMIESVRERGQVPDIVVVQGINELPEPILNEMRASQMELAPGLFHQKTQTIYLIADNIAHPQALWMTVAHELAGHYGLRAVLGEDYIPMMNAIYDGNKDVQKNVEARLKRNKDTVKDPSLWMTKEEAVEEYVAEAAEPDPKLTWVNRLVNAIKTFLRSAGFTIPIGNSEIIRLIRDANKYTYGDAVRVALSLRKVIEGREKGYARGALRPSLATSAKDRFEAAEIERLDEPGFKSREKLVEINIDDFLNLSDQVTEGAYTGGKLKDTRSYLKDGGKFNSLPFFQYDIDDDNVAHVVGHEGRHRALALKELGYTTMPVVLRGPIRWSEQADPNKFDYVEEFPTRLKAQEKAKSPNFTIPFPVTRETAGQPYSGSMSRVMYSTQDDDSLLEKHNRPNTPMLEMSPVKTALLKTAKTAKEFIKDLVSEPTETITNLADQFDYPTWLRTKAFWFGAGLERADFRRYGGQVKKMEGVNFVATATLALDNMLRASSIGVRVLFQGAIQYDPNTLTYKAVNSNFSMKNIYESQFALRKQIGAQRAEDLIQSYLEAKRSLSIKNEYEKRKQDLENAIQTLDALNSNPQANPADVLRAQSELEEVQADFESIKIPYQKIIMSDEAIGEFIAVDQKYPELRTIMNNWNRVNQNLLKFWRDVGLLSKGRYDTLSNIKDYVPWYRIMNDDEDVHSPGQTRSATNIGKEKIFKRGKPNISTTFTAKANQQIFKINPATVVKVTINGKKVRDNKVTATPDGEVAINVPIHSGDLVVFNATHEIDNIIGNMTNNVMRMTYNGLRQYAATRIVKEYATRNTAGKIMRFTREDPAKGRFNFIVDGKRMIVEIQDPLIAQAVYGMDPIGMEMWQWMVAVQNFVRRGITLSGAFQIKQVFVDAPTASLVTGVKNPAALIGGVWAGLARCLFRTDPAFNVLQSHGLGMFVSPSRPPEFEIKKKIGVIAKNPLDFINLAIDHFGDSADAAQRTAVYNRVLKETGDEALAVYQAANVINFQHRGSTPAAQWMSKMVVFMGAWANAIDVLSQALIGGGLKGVERSKAIQRLAITGGLLSMTTLIYCMLKGKDDDYWEEDELTRLRNYLGPNGVTLPMNTGAAALFKMIPELAYVYIMTQGTDNEMDKRRLANALGTIVEDAILGPTPIPTAIKPLLEVKVNYNFFTKKPIVPEALQKMDAFQQYTMGTSELAKMLSSFTGTKENRLLNPMEMDHVIRSLFGTVGSMAQWMANALSGERPAMNLKEYPVIGAFMRAEVPRGNETLFYDLADVVDRKWNTYKKLERREIESEYDLEHIKLLDMHKSVNKIRDKLSKLNRDIDEIGTGEYKGADAWTPEKKREEITKLQQDKRDLLKEVPMLRQDAGL